MQSPGIIEPKYAALGGHAVRRAVPQVRGPQVQGLLIGLPRDSDLATKSRTYNSVAFGNATYFFTPNLSIGLELSYLHTGYKDLRDGDDFRKQLSLIYKF